jgi:RNA polymerase-binding transcription factor DksA
VITLPRSTELSPARTAIAARLEQEYETHTERLAVLTTTGAASHHRPRAGRPDRLAAHTDAVISARRALADVAQALRRLAEGTYGLCEHCLDEIPVDDLESSPAARWCRSCGVSAAY